MKYGFVIDNRKCIGCHACTTACKSEHQVPVGVNRTWVKQVEKGEFPNTRRLFSVMRCNHCTDAPCVDICPTESLYTREDGIVDFDKDRCIGCKSCMQACPYDALYIDPETETAAKCNYCAHRVDMALEPACVNVCPEQAIISGDMDNPDSEISQLLARQQVSVRKREKGTIPNLFYIDADEASLVPTATPRTGEYLWSQQATGVGHFAKEAEKMAYSNGDVISELLKINDQYSTAEEVATNGPKKSVQVLMGKEARRVYDTPDKGILWGWEVSAYVWTKAISAGAFLVAVLSLFAGSKVTEQVFLQEGIIISIIFLVLTGILLVMDLDQPKRFLYVLLRPHWKSWLVKGGYAITIFGGLLSLLLMNLFLEWDISLFLVISTSIFALIVAVYTAFLFGQAKGRDFWQSPTLAIHMLVHSFMAGAAVFCLLGGLGVLGYAEASLFEFWKNILLIGIGANLLTILFELTTTHPTEDAKYAVEMITKGRYKNSFYLMVVLVGNLIPFLMMLLLPASSWLLPLAGIMVLVGLYFLEHIWVEAPQRIPLT